MFLNYQAETSKIMPRIQDIGPQSTGYSKPLNVENYTPKMTVIMKFLIIMIVFSIPKTLFCTFEIFYLT